jgi:hypothetical protein
VISGPEWIAALLASAADPPSSSGFSGMPDSRSTNVGEVQFDGADIARATRDVAALSRMLTLAP